MKGELAIRRGCSYCLAAGLGVGGVLLSMTNPGSQDYEEFATQQTLGLLNQDVCAAIQGDDRAGQRLNVQQQCTAIGQNGSADVRQFVTHNTQRQDFILCSLYKTELPLHSLTVIGIYNHFFLLSVDGTEFR